VHNANLRTPHRHLHSELRKISQDVNTVFGIEMTLKMSSYYSCVVLGLHKIFSILFIDYYMTKNLVYCITIVFWTFLYILRFIFINYMCEKVCIKVYSVYSLYRRLCLRKLIRRIVESVFNPCYCFDFRRARWGTS